MGQITSGIGLISGINTADLIEKLLSLEARPKTLITQRNQVLQAKQVGYQDINAKLLALKVNTASFVNTKSFSATTVTSSNQDVLTATSSSTATPGTYSFSVSQLVNTQQLISQGFSDSGTTPLGAGTLTFEFGNARLDSDTALSQLNGGAGVNRGKIRITDRSGAAATVDLSRALSVGDVIDAINNTGGINVTASISGDGLTLTDNTGAVTTALSVANVGTTNTATGLGLTVASVGTTITGTQINTIGDATLLASLNDGNGVHTRGVLSDFQITRRDGTTFEVSLNGASKIGDVIEKINTASGGNVTASVNLAGTGLQLVDATGGGGNLEVTALNSSGAARDLGILGSVAGATLTGTRLIAGLNSRLLRNLHGGSGATGLGTISITNRAGASFTVDVSAASSVADVISAINTAGSGSSVSATLNSAGTGIELTDATGATASNFIVSDVSGTGAASLGLVQSVAAARIDGGNLQFRYITESTRRDSLNGGLGVAKGSFKITDSSGVSATVDLSQGDEATIGDIINEINSRGLLINARVNDNGDGILIEDTGPGTVAIKVEESGSTVAKELGLLGEASAAGEDLDGTYEKTIEIDADDTLNDLVSKINEADLDVSAGIINDGSPANPYRLSLLSTKPGKGGAFVFDDGGLGLGTSTLVEAQDAVVFYGSSDPAKAIAITSSSNTLDSLISGASIKLVSTSDTPVNVSITRDDASIKTTAKKFVTDFNAVIATLDKYDKYDAETQTKGLLLGDSTLSQIRFSLFRLINNRNGDLSTQYKALAQIGISIGGAGTLEFNETRFDAAMSNDRAAVEQLFTFKETETVDGVTTTTAAGIGVKIDQLLEKITASSDGLISKAIDASNDILKLNNDSIKRLEARLAAKKLVLQTQFAQMESTLAQMQQQSTALGSFSNILGSMNTSGG